MRVLVLGGLRASGSGPPADITGERHQRILAALVLAGPDGLSVEALAERVWDPPESPLSPVPTLRTYVRRLRALAMDPEATLVVTRPGGYRLAVGPDDVDADVFTRLARDAAREIDSDRAAELLDAALGLWRGPAFAGLEHVDWLATEVSRLTELRLAAQEHRLALWLDSGRPDVAPEAERLLGEHPYRERLVALRALALYRAGGQGEALAAITAHRRRLADELGVDVAVELQDIEGAILRQDPRLLGPGTIGRPLRGYRLGPRVGGYGGSVVHRAREESGGREVAVTMLGGDRANDPAFIRRLTADAERLARLTHPGIVQLVDFWRETDRAVIVTEWVAGASLADRLARDPPTAAQSAALIRQVADALDAAHSRGVHHGALTASRILIDDHDDPVLTGFVPGSGSTTAEDTAALGEILADLLAASETSSDGDDPAAEDLRAAVERARRGEYATAGALAADAAPSWPPAPQDGQAMENPFRGLEPFSETDAAAFHGRERLVDTLLERLGHDRAALLVGPSGSGKSSVLHAGAVPRLRSGQTPVLVSSMVPGHDPFGSLAAALDMVAATPGLDVRQALLNGVPLVDLVARISPDAPMLVVVDQLEELAALADPTTAEQFFELLAGAVAAASPQLRVLLAIRADFFDRPLSSPSFGPHVARIDVPIAPMSADELHAAITRPAAAAGVTFTEAVVARLIGDVLGQPTSLPLLQFALTEMFAHRSDGQIGLSDYEQVGGVAGALARSAEEDFAALDPTEREAVRLLLLRLLVVGDAVSSRRESLTRLLTLPGVTRRLVDRLTAARLVTVDQDPRSRAPTVELAHEALVDAWPRLRGWVDSSRDHLAVATRLRADTLLWLDADRDASLLPRGPALERAEKVANDDSVGLSDEERAFAAAAVAQREKEAAESARQAAGRAQARRRRRLTGVSLVTAAVVAVGAVLVGAVTSRRAAEERATAAQAQLIGTATTLQGTRPDLALLLSAEAYVRDPGPVSQRALLGSIRQYDGVAEVWTQPRFAIGTAQGGCVNIVEPGVLVVQPNSQSDQGFVARGAVVEIDVARRTVRRLQDTQLVCDVRRVPTGAAAGAGGAHYVGETIDGSVVALDERGRAVLTLDGYAGPLFGPDGELLARRASDAATDYVRVDPTTGKAGSQALFTAEHAWRSPDASQYLVVESVEFGESGAVAPLTLVDARTFERVATLGTTLPSSPPAWGRDDRIVAYADEQGTLGAWDAATGVRLLEVPDVRASLVAVSPDGRTLALSTGTGHVEYRDLSDGRVLDEVDPGVGVLMELEWVDPTTVAALAATGVTAILSRDAPGLGERTQPCCGPTESGEVVPDGQPNPYAFVRDHAAGSGRFVDLVDGSTHTVDMSAHVDQDWLSEVRLPEGDAVLAGPDGILRVDRSGELVASRELPVSHARSGRPGALLRVNRGAGDELVVLGVPGASSIGVTALEVAWVDPVTLATTHGPIAIDLPLPARYVTLRQPGIIVLDHGDLETGHWAIRDLEGTVLADVTPPAPAGWVALTGGRRHVVAARASDDSLRVIDLATGRTTVLPINAEPQGPTMLADSRFLIQTREGQLELWDADGPQLLGVLADPGSYAWTYPRLAPDESAVWVLLHGAWTRIPLDPHAWLAKACALAGRVITEQEWRDFVPGDEPHRDACASRA